MDMDVDYIPYGVAYGNIKHLGTSYTVPIPAAVH